MLVTVWLRAMTTFVGHGVWTGLICAAIWRGKGTGAPRWDWQVLWAYLFSSLLHGLWDWSPAVFMVPVGLVGTLLLRERIQQASAAEQQAAFQFIKWITTPERAAQWSIDTGYVAVRPDSYDTDAMKKYVAEFPPAAVARDQLKFAVAELSTHENQRVTKPFNDGIQAALNGTKSAEQAMKDAQAEAERILRQYR